MASKLLAWGFLLFVKTISAQVVGMYPAVGPNMAAEAAVLAGLGPGVPYGPAMAPPYPGPLPLESPRIGCSYGLKLSDLGGNGGAFAVTSTSPFTPNGVSVQSDNLAFEGPLAVTGTMPFLGSVALEGPLPAEGAGAVAYGCGNGNVGIAEELTSPPAAVYPGPGPAGYNPGPRGPYGPMY